MKFKILEKYSLIILLIINRLILRISCECNCGEITNEHECLECGENCKFFYKDNSCFECSLSLTSTSQYYIKTGTTDSPECQIVTLEDINGTPNKYMEQKKL